MVFFLSADEKMYARYGGRDAKDADSRQSAAGLKYTMNSVLAMHEGKTPSFAPRLDSKPRTTRDLPGKGRGCMHCHNVKEAMNRKLITDGEWSRDLVYRYPLPENLGLRLEVDRGNVVERVEDGTPAAKAGLKKGDRLAKVNGLSISSFADLQHALHRAPPKGTIPLSWVSGGKERSAKLTLVEDWKRTDLSWRWSLRAIDPQPWVHGVDLTAQEKKMLGLSPNRMAICQGGFVSEPARQAGIRQDDVIVGVGGKELEMTARQFSAYVRLNYKPGDRVVYNLLRDGKPVDVTITLRGR